MTARTPNPTLGGGARGQNRSSGQRISLRDTTPQAEYQYPNHSAPLTIIVAPVARRPGYFRVHLGGRILVAASRQPFCDAARLLLAECRDPRTILVMKHMGAATESLRGSIGTAAQLTVEERANSGPRFAAWRPSPFDAGSAGTAISPSADTGERAERLAVLGTAP